MPDSKKVREWLFSPRGGVSLCADNGIEIAGPPPQRHKVRLTPDSSKAYLEFAISHSWPAITAFGTSIHPATVVRSYDSMLHQVFNLSHLMKEYSPRDQHGKVVEKTAIPHDNILGGVAAVELAGLSPGCSPTLTGDQAWIRGAAHIFKNAERVPKLLGEHLAGRHKWSVSMEVDFSPLDSGFLVRHPDQAKPAQAALLAEFTPAELKGSEWGYVPAVNAPEELLACYDLEKTRIVKPWGKLPVVLLKGGFDGTAHFYGVGLVRYGAEREAEVLQIMASDPDLGGGAEWSERALEHFRKASEESAKLAESLRGFFAGK